MRSSPTTSPFMSRRQEPPQPTRYPERQECDSLIRIEETAVASGEHHGSPTTLRKRQLKSEIDACMRWLDDTTTTETNEAASTSYHIVSTSSIERKTEKSTGGGSDLAYRVSQVERRVDLALLDSKNYQYQQASRKQFHKLQSTLGQLERDISQIQDELATQGIMACGSAVQTF